MRCIDRRTLLRRLGPAAVLALSGCLDASGRRSAGPPAGPDVIASTTPVRTEGDSVSVSRAVTRSLDAVESPVADGATVGKPAGDPPSADIVFAAIDALRDAITARSDCVAGDVPVGRRESGGLLVSVVSMTAGDPGRGDIAAKVEPYFHLRAITPRTVTVSLTDGRRTRSRDLPVSLRGVVRRGERGGVTPSVSSDDC